MGVEENSLFAQEYESIKDFRSANTWEELFDLLERNGPLANSADQEFTSGEWRQSIEAAMTDTSLRKYITNNKGLRDTYDKLMESSGLARLDKFRPNGTKKKIEHETIKNFDVANSWEELFDLLEQHGPLANSSGQEFTPSQWRQLIENAIDDPLQRGRLTNNKGLRNTYDKLIAMSDRAAA